MTQAANTGKTRREDRSTGQTGIQEHTDGKKTDKSTKNEGKTRAMIIRE